MCKDGLAQLLQNNKQWVQSKLNKDKKYFDKLANQHNPKYLWIGCSDARVPANSIVGLEAGEVFVHRNVGNIVSHTDINIKSVIGYAVEVLKVEHIILTGHYRCGAIKASLSSKSFGTVDSWIYHIRHVIRENDEQLAKLSGEDKERKLCELNVKTQVRHIAESHILKTAWTTGQKISVHGWIYDVADGIIKDLDCTVNSENCAKVLEPSAVVSDS